MECNRKDLLILHFFSVQYNYLSLRIFIHLFPESLSGWNSLEQKTKNKCPIQQCPIHRKLTNFKNEFCWWILQDFPGFCRILSDSVRLQQHCHRLTLVFSPVAISFVCHLFSFASIVVSLCPDVLLLAITSCLFFICCIIIIS